MERIELTCDCGNELKPNGDGVIVPCLDCTRDAHEYGSEEGREDGYDQASEDIHTEREEFENADGHLVSQFYKEFFNIELEVKVS